MPIYGIALCDAGFEAVALGTNDGEIKPVQPEGGEGPLGWMGLAYHDGQKFWFGRRAEDAWLVHPRQVSHNFWGRLSRETAQLAVAGKHPSFSQLAYYFLRDLQDTLTAAGPMEKVALAVPGAYLKDAATEDEKIGLLLGMAAELKLPLAGVVDMACASLGDPRVDYFDSSLPVLVVDVHLHGAEITLLRSRREGELAREGFSLLPQSGYAELLRHVTTSMGNRFLRHTTFDILEDGRIEQAFYRQCKQFVLSRASEHRFQINTANRAYELTATREQLAADTAAFTQAIVAGAQALLPRVGGRVEPCTVALSERTALLPGIAARFRAAGLPRVLRLPSGAAATGAARLAAQRPVAADLSEIPVDTVAPQVAERAGRKADLSLRVLKGRSSGDGVPPPTHAICEGLGHVLNGHASFTIGVRGTGVDLPLPEDFIAAGSNCRVRLERDAGRWWLLDEDQTDAAGRTAMEAGDRLVLRCGDAESEVLFAHCAPAHHRS
ncbi:MAG TPA: hypothetical protein VEB66_02200 [Opitutaceae bacterium]|nr:hypothetical protein [Opitutaceae bacterium]